MTTCIESHLKGPAELAWQFFLKISSIPRPSGHEEKVSKWLQKIATENEWITKCDHAGNLLIKVPGKGELAGEKPICIQGHLDMVCEKNSDIIHDFFSDPLNLVIDGDWIKASGTTLGADNGVAIALGLAVANVDVPHRLPLELLFTVEEETGLIGANNLDADLVSARTFVNIDTEEEGTFIIGCAGGELVNVEFDVEEIVLTSAFRCSLSGLRGGHSGLDVTTRFNAISESGKIIKNLKGAKLHSFESGDAHNAIPRECNFTVSNCTMQEIEAAAKIIVAAIKESESEVTFTISPCEASKQLPNSLIDFLTEIKDGVLSMHPQFEGIVQTSTSVTVVKQAADKIAITISTRSSDEDDKFATNNKIVEQAIALGAVAVRHNSYPGWSPQKKSRILQHCSKLYSEMFGNTPRVNSIHAGLECGIIGQALNTTELISLGPNIYNPHSAEERLSISSFNRIYQFLEKIVTTKIN